MKIALNINWASRTTDPITQRTVGMESYNAMAWCANAVAHAVAQHDNDVADDASADQQKYAMTFNF